MPHRGYLVADRDWRYHDYAASWRHGFETRISQPPVLRRATRPNGFARQTN